MKRAFISHDENKGEFNGHVFSIKNELDQISRERHDTVYRELSTAQKRDQIRFKYYDLLWHGFLYPNGTDLAEVIIVYKELTEFIEQNDISILIYDSLPSEYQIMLEDIEENKDICVKSRGKKRRNFYQIRLILNYLLSVPLVMIFLLDQVLGIINRKLSITDLSSDIIFMPDIARPKSMISVIEKATKFERTSDSIVTPMLPSWVFSKLFNEYPLLHSINSKPISLYSTVKSVLRQIYLIFIYLPDQLLIKKKLQADLERHMLNEFGIKLNETTQYMCCRSFSVSTPRYIMLADLVKSIKETTNCKGIVVGTGSPLGRSLLIGANEADLDSYFIPHSVATPMSENFEEDVIHYVSGEYDLSFLKQSSQVDELWNVKPYGRPYFDNLNHSLLSDTNNTLTEPVTIMIATQPFPKKMKNIVNLVLESLKLSTIEANLIIKTHPSEEVSFYLDFLNNNELDVDVLVVEDDLEKNLRKSDLVITLSSNVGLEGMLMDSVCVCVYPSVKNYRQIPYTRHESIPTLRNNSDICQFFKTLDEEWFLNLKEQQREFVKDGFKLDGKSAERIVHDIMRPGE